MLLQAVKHHRAVLDYIDHLSEMEFDAASGIEPVSAKARDSAFRLLARRVDLAIGMSVQASSTGGVKMDVLRNGREFLIEIDSKGRISVVSAASAPDRRAFGISHRSINKDFFSALEQEIPDPIQDQVPDSDLMPLPGVITQEISGPEILFRVSAAKRRFMGVQVANARYGFNIACFLTDDDAGIDCAEIEGLVQARLEAGTGVYLGRRFRDTPMVSLHDICQCPPEVLRGGVLPVGLGLLDLKRRTVEARRANETSRNLVTATGN